MILTEIAVDSSEQITPDLQQKIDEWKSRAGNLIMILHAIQNHYGYVPRNISMYLANQLDVPLARIYEVLTFYHFFKLEPPADNTIQVCTGTACYLKGAGKLVEEFRKILGLKANESYTEDRKFKLEEVRCIGCCGLAPVINVNAEVAGKINPDQVKDIIEKLKQVN